MDSVIFLLETGLRRGEMLGLMWSNIDFKSKTLSVNRSYSIENGSGKIRPPKWDSYRTIPLMPSTICLLNRLPHDSLYVFPAPKGRGLEDPNDYSRRLYNFFNHLPENLRCSAHELRHSYASQLMRRGVGIYTISKVLRHRDIKITASVYVHPDIEKFRDEISSKLLLNSDDILTTRSTDN